MPTLADIFSAADTFKRNLSDLASNPGASLQQMLGYANDRARNFNQTMSNATNETVASGNPFDNGPANQALNQAYAGSLQPVGMINQPIKGSLQPALEDISYRGSHTAPGPDFGAPLHDLTGGGQMYPSDVYAESAARIYGTGYPKADKEAFALAKQVKGKPDAEVTMYRAVPKDESIKDINKGDWVTLSKSYAQNHGEAVLGDNYKILSKKVKAKDLWTNADSIHEFGYHPQ